MVRLSTVGLRELVEEFARDVRAIRKEPQALLFTGMEVVDKKYLQLCTETAVSAQVVPVSVVAPWMLSQ